MSVLQNFDLEALEAEEFMTAVFASSTCSHRSWKLILRGGHFATFSQFSVRRMVRVGAAKGQSCPPRPTLSLEKCTEDDSEVLENETKREDADS